MVRFPKGCLIPDRVRDMRNGDVAWARKEALIPDKDGLVLLDLDAGIVKWQSDIHCVRVHKTLHVYEIDVSRVDPGYRWDRQRLHNRSVIRAHSVTGWRCN